MAPSSSSLLYCSLVGVGVALAFKRYRKAHALPHPPGPPAHPIWGNALDVPASQQWIEFTRFGKIYGPVLHLQVLTQHVIVLSSLDAVFELLDKRGNIYSDRPAFTMLNDLMGWGWFGATLPYGDLWRAHRRVYHYYFHEGASKGYLDVQARANLVFLRGILESPHRFMDHIHYMTTSSIMSLSYGIDVTAEDDPWVKLVNDAMHTMTAAGLPGSFAVDWVPALRYIPSWFPGAAFQKYAQVSQTLAGRFRTEPLEWAKGQIQLGKSGTSVAASLLQNGLEGRPLSDELIATTVATIYIAGADTTVAVLAAFFLCMVLYPEKQKNAQEEIDRALGHGHLPAISDRGALPYVTAVMLEVIRLYPILPLGLPHRVMEEDEYQGMRIPKGSTIMPNIWSIFRNEELYTDPNEFRPERYLRDGVLNFESVTDPRLLLFGFGRRICPGRHFADAAAWTTIATVLACFNIAPIKDENGANVIPSGEMIIGIVTCPKPFPCEISPRSEETKHALVAALDAM
ncbi:cytochrome P450 [Auricularia subglabra TFB-10046 SS5]|nr:cytochrome P450 [Auricularia subglabra TFB-10046 SS5]